LGYGYRLTQPTPLNLNNNWLKEVPFVTGWPFLWFLSFRGMDADGRAMQEQLAVAKQKKETRLSVREPIPNKLRKAFHCL
jgi:hypothetical protein